MLPLAIMLPGAALAASEDGHEFITFLGFTLEAGTFADVAAELGEADQVSLGGNDNSVISICYTADSEVISFTSGAEHDLEGFSVAEKTKENAVDCRPLPANLVKGSTALAGLHIGMSKKEFTNIVGVNVEWDGNTGSHYFSSKQEMTAQDLAQFNVSKGEKSYFDVGVSVEGIFSEDSLKKFEVTKITTY